MSVISRETDMKPEAGEAVTPAPLVPPPTNTRVGGSVTSRLRPVQVGPQSIVTLKADQASGLRDLVAAFHQDVVTTMNVATTSLPAQTQAVPTQVMANQVAATVIATPRRSAAAIEANANVGTSRNSAVPSVPTPTRLRRVPVIAVTSGKGGVGKTSIAVNLCVLLAQRHVRTTLIDADMGLANADVLCGLSPIHRLDCTVPILQPGSSARPLPRSMRSIALEAPGGFRLVPGSVGVSRMANLASVERAALLDAMLELEHENDLIAIDTGAGLSEGVMGFVRHADLAVVVVTPEPTSIADAYATIKLLRNTEKTQHATRTTKVGVIVNMAHSEIEAKATFERIRGTCQRFLKFEPTFLGVVSADQAIPQAIRARVPMAVGLPGCKATRELRGLADRCAQEAGVKLTERGTAKPRGWWQRLWASSKA